MRIYLIKASEFESGYCTTRLPFKKRNKNLDKFGVKLHRVDSKFGGKIYKQTIEINTLEELKELSKALNSELILTTLSKGDLDGYCEGEYAIKIYDSFIE